MLSPAVAAAQERLRELRARRAESRREGTAAAGERGRGGVGERGSGDATPVPGGMNPTAARQNRLEAGCRSAGTSLAPLPPCPPAPLHSWEEIARRGLYSQTLAAHLRAAGWGEDAEEPGSRDAGQKGRQSAHRGSTAPTDTTPFNPPTPPGAQLFSAPPPPCPPAALPPQAPAHVKVHPDIALAILRAKQAAPGRVWLLLRHADAAGRGAIDERAARRLLSGPDAPLRVCGRRQLANLLAAGDGLFWERAAGVIWLRSVVRLAATLGVARLGGAPVAVPVAALTGPIGRARAHLYASFHSGRQGVDLLTGTPRPRGPIARATLTALSAAAPNSQRAYERRAGVGRRSAVAIGPPAGAVDEHEVAWRRGRALFHLRDRKGRFGRPGAVYLAWQLPNEYTGPHATLPRGRQKRLNRALADLFLDGMTGNGEQPGGAIGRPRRRFYGSAKPAALARHDGERYWRGRGGEWYWQEGKDAR